MTLVQTKTSCWRAVGGLLFIVSLCAVLLVPGTVRAETYGVKDAQGSFVPKITITLEDSEITIRKVNPRDKFQSIALKLNPRNRDLIKNVASLDIVWIAPGNRPGKPTPFAGSLYDRNTRVFMDTMVKSVGMKIVDRSKRSLFAGQKLDALFAISVDHQPLVSSESVKEGDQTVQLGRGRDVSINVDKTLIVFNESNFKRGEMINVDNRTGVEQTLGIELPEQGLVLSQVRRRLEQTKIPKEQWDRFKLAPDAGVFVVLIPEPDPKQMALLNGKAVVIKVLQGNQMRPLRRIPIEVTLEPSAGETEPSTGPEPATARDQRPPSSLTPPPSGVSPTTQEGPPIQETRRTQPPAESRRNSQAGISIWLWILPVANLVLLVALAVHGFFFVLPKIQVLEDRVAKSEMFIHGSREAIREELDQIKKEIMEQFRRDSEG